MKSRDAAVFWRLVDVLDMRSCWMWKGTQQNGYGCYAIKSRQHGAHRIAWAFAYGKIPVGKLVLHACDEPLCVNPRHLRLGTHEENGLDKSVLSRVRKAIADFDEAEEREAAREAAAEQRRLLERADLLIPGGPDVLYYTTLALEPLNRLSEAKFAASNMTATGVAYIRDLYRIHGVDFRTIAKVCRLSESRTVGIICRSMWRHVP